MKKLTAGIFTVLLGVVTAQSADAALTSKAYVDAQVGTKVSTSEFNEFKTGNTTAISDAKKAGTDAAAALETYKTENNAAVAKKADQTAMETALAGKQQKLNSTNFKKDGTGNVISGVTVDESGNVTFATSTVATAEGLENLTNTVAGHTTALGTLNGAAETTGSVANQIAAAITAETTRADGAYDAKGAAATAETNAKTYADGLGKNYASAAQGKTADDTAAAVNNATTGLATKASKTYVDEELAKKQNTLKQGTNITIADDGTISATYTYDDSGLAGRVTTLEGTGVTKEKIDAIATNTANIAKKQDTLTEAQLNAVNSGITAAKVTTYDGYAAKITSAQTQADKGVEDAAAAKAVADKAIPKPGADCTTLGAKCVLVVGENGYAWESVERATGETTGA